jgi:hypothetical protein
MTLMSRLACLAVAALAAWPQGAASQVVGGPGYALRFPYVPQLIVDEDKDLCAQFRAELHKQFLTNQPVIDLTGARVPGWIWHFADGNNIAAPQQYYERLRATYTIREIRLRDDGPEQLLVHFTQPFNWKGDWYTLGLFDSRDDLNAALARGEPGSRLIPDRFVVAQAGWMPHPVLQNNGRFYVLQQHFSDIVHNAVHVLRQINAQGGLIDTCAVAATPRDWNERERAALPALQRLAAALAPILGYRGPCDGTSNAGAIQQFATAEARMMAQARPWALVLGPPDPANPFYRRDGARHSFFEIDVHLANWALESLGNFRAVRELPALLAAAREELALYYRREFGINMPDAEDVADNAVDQIFRRHFSIYIPYPHLHKHPAAFDAAAILRADDMIEREATDQLLLAALHGVDGAVIDHLIALGANVRDANTAPFAPTRREAPIFFALEHTHIVRQLLGAGADPNDINDFGKTPLMYAAQYDLVESARALLEHGADVNRATAWRKELMCAPRLGYDQRTALMYAAENASLDMITLLLGHGADRKAIDTGRRGLESYLARNTRLAPAEKEAAGRLLDSGPVNP